MNSSVTVLLILFTCSTMTGKTQSYIRVKEGRFYHKNDPYPYIGTNYWQGMVLASGLIPDGKKNVIQDLDSLAAIGVTNLRIMAEANGPDTEPYRILPSLQKAPGRFEEQLFIGLDFLLSEMSKRRMKAVICLSNFWPWSGGMAQYVAWSDGTDIPYPDAGGHTWHAYQKYAAQFYRDQRAISWYEQFVAKVVKRINTITGIAYSQDPTIMSWQLANEPRGYTQKKPYIRWVRRSAEYIKSLDPNHLVSIGSEGTTHVFIANNAYKKVSKIDAIDYMTAHVWIENWNWYDPEMPKSISSAVQLAVNYLDKHQYLAAKIGKPLVLEEFGIARDERSYDPKSTVIQRNNYYQRIFEYLHHALQKRQPLQGVNFWAYAGIGYPDRPGFYWESGQTLTGDPPHEKQGWYSVYQSDNSTIKLIKKYNQLIHKIHE